MFLWMDSIVEMKVTVSSFTDFYSSAPIIGHAGHMDQGGRFNLRFIRIYSGSPLLPVSKLYDDRLYKTNAPSPPFILTRQYQWRAISGTSRMGSICQTIDAECSL